MNPPPSRAERKESSRRAILRAARERFIENGYEGTTIRDIAKAAGLSPGSVIVHFEGKRALLFACFLDNIAQAQSRIWDTLDEQAPLVDQLLHCAQVLYEAYAEHPALSQVMFRETLFPKPGDPPDDQFQPFLARIAGLYGAALERGEIRRLPAGGMVAAQGFFALYITGLIGGLGGFFGEHPTPRAAGQAWAAGLRPLLMLQHQGLGAPIPHEGETIDDPSKPSEPSD